jgi:hypothetical protein
MRPAMRIATSIVVALLIAAVQPALAATAQQEKMKTCNADAATKHLQGDDRKTYMKTCLSASGSAAVDKKELTPQQQKMSTCSKDAASKKLKGDARKEFMSSCLKG